MPTIVLQPNEANGIDTFCNSGGVDQNFGAADYMRVGVEASGINNIALVKFDLSSIPSNAIIVSATLSLYQFEETSTTDFIYTARRSLQQWYEGIRNGENPAEDGSTWNHRNANGSVTWTGSNAASTSNFSSSSNELAQGTATGNGNWINFNVTLTTQGFVDGSFENHGWGIGFNISSLSHKIFRSSSASNASERPKLTIEYIDITTVFRPDGDNGEDTYLHSTLTDHNYGSSAFIAVGSEGSSNYRGLIRFDLSSIPSTAEITFAELRLFCVSENNGIDRNITVNRSLVEWFEGNESDAVPGNGEDASTWDSRNHNGSVAWGSSGGQSGVDYDSTPTDTVTIVEPNLYYSWDVLSDIQDFVSGQEDNYGWFVLETSEIIGSRKIFASSDHETSSIRPALYLIFTTPIYADIEGTATVEGSLKATGNLRGSIEGTSTFSGFFSTTGRLEGSIAGQATVSALGKSNQNVSGSSAGSSLVEGYIVGSVKRSASAEGKSFVSGDLYGVGYARGQSENEAVVTALIKSNEWLVAVSPGSATVSGLLVAKGYVSAQATGQGQGRGTLKAIGYAHGVSEGISSNDADIKGIYLLEGSSEGAAFAEAAPDFLGRLRGRSDGTSVVIGGIFSNYVRWQGDLYCHAVPLFYITDGSFKDSGQQNMLNLISEENGYRLNEWNPSVAQFKDGGRWANSPTAQGRRLKSYVFDNAIEVIDLNLVGYDQNKAIQFLHELWDFQQAVASYWSSAWASLPVYLVSKAAREKNTSYAIIHQISCPQLRNIFSQPFFDEKRAVFDTITLRIERGHWLSSPPGQYEPVLISSFRTWTVAGWKSD